MCDDIDNDVLLMIFNGRARASWALKERERERAINLLSWIETMMSSTTIPIPQRQWQTWYGQKIAEDEEEKKIDYNGEWFMSKTNPNVELSSFPSVCDSVMRWLAYEKTWRRKKKRRTTDELVGRFRVHYNKYLIMCIYYQTVQCRGWKKFVFLMGICYEKGRIKFIAKIPNTFLYHMPSGESLVGNHRWNAWEKIF